VAAGYALSAFVTLVGCIWSTENAAAAEGRTSRVEATDVLAIDAGGPGIANWRADIGSPGYTLRTKSLIVTSGVRGAAPQSVYGSLRFFSGPLVYSMAGLKAGSAYTVRLHFAELVDDARGQRVFNIGINGRRAFTNFDVFAAAGGKFRAVVEDVAATADGSGQIGIQLTPVRGNPIINGLEVQRATSPRIVVLNKAHR
jgi:hypothetical protein